MKTLKQLAAEHNYFLATEIPSSHSHIPIREEPLPEGVLEECTEYEAGVFYGIRIQDEGTDREYKYIEAPQHFIKRKGSDLICELPIRPYTKKWELYTAYISTRHLHSLSRYKIDEIQKRLKVPNQIGVFTTKKILDWLQFLEALTVAKQAVYDSIQQDIANNRKEIYDFYESLSGYKTIENNRSKSQDSYHIETPLFSIQFVISLEAGYLRKRAEFKGTFVDIVNISKLLSNGTK